MERISMKKNLMELDWGECVIFCLDSSEWMRAEDYEPFSRWEAQCQATNAYIEEKAKRGENSCAIITTGGKRANCEISFTEEAYLVAGALTKVKVAGIHNHHGDALKLAQMMFNQRIQKKQKQRIVWFVGSPLEIGIEELYKIALKLKKNGIIVDILNFGEMSEEKTQKLQVFHKTLLKTQNCNLINCECGENMSEHLLNTIVMEPKWNYNPLTRSSNKKKGSDEEDLNEASILSLHKPQCRKAVLDRQRYKIISRQISIPITALSFSMKQSKLLIILHHPHSSRKLIGSFKAGTMKYNTTTKMVTPDKTKGELSLYLGGDSKYVFEWRDSAYKMKPLEIVVQPGVVEYKWIDTCTTGNVYLLEIHHPNSIIPSRYFFWNQESSSSVKDKEFWFIAKQSIDNYKEKPINHFPMSSVGEILSGVDAQSLLDSLSTHKLNIDPPKNMKETSKGMLSSSFSRKDSTRKLFRSFSYSDDGLPLLRPKSMDTDFIFKKKLIRKNIEPPKLEQSPKEELEEEKDTDKPPEAMLEMAAMKLRHLLGRTRQIPTNKEAKNLLPSVPVPLSGPTTTLQKIPISKAMENTETQADDLEPPDLVTTNIYDVLKRLHDHEEDNE